MRLAPRAAAAGALLLGNAAAEAHGASAALGGFGGGFIHPLLEPAHLLSVITVALLLGQPGLRRSRDALFALAAGLLLGLVLAALGRGGDADAALLVLAAIAGVLVAIGHSWPPPLLGAIAAAAGAGIGLGSAPDGGTPVQRTLALAGAFVGACLWIGDGALLVGLLQRPWGRLLVRVVGSWMAAVALLVLALQFAPARGA